LAGDGEIRRCASTTASASTASSTAAGENKDCQQQKGSQTFPSKLYVLHRTPLFLPHVVAFNDQILSIAAAKWN
jgi:hypothetical protein